jgi:hypothetical protein
VLWQFNVADRCLAAITAAINNPTNTPTIPIVTSNSTSVNPVLLIQPTAPE